MVVGADAGEDDDEAGKWKIGDVGNPKMLPMPRLPDLKGANGLANE
jgi:hypothetical protein